MKKELSSEPILQYPNYKKEFYLETDASNVGLGCVLSQKDERTGKLRPISYASRVLNKAEKNYSTTEKEALAIVWGLKKYRYIIYGYGISVMTDHKPLTSLFTNTLPPGRLGRWALLVQEFGLKIFYNPGVLNSVPDALSRNTNLTEIENNKEILAIASTQLGQTRPVKQPVPAWEIEELQEELKKDKELKQLYEHLVEGKDTKKLPKIKGHRTENFFVKNGVLYYKEN